MNPRGLDAASFGADRTDSLIDLLETDAMLDVLSRRGLFTVWDGTAAGSGSSAGPITDDPAVRLLQALSMSVDEGLVEDVDPIAVATLAAGFEMSAMVADALQALDAVSAPADLMHPVRSRRLLGRDRLQLVGGTAGRPLPRRRPYRAVAVVAGVALALGGGGFAAAATTDPQHAWGPLRPMVLALHPGWQSNLFAAKRAEIIRTLDRAAQQSAAGLPVAAAVSYGTASQQARELPKGPDADLTARLNAVARQLGLTGPSGPYVGPPSGPGPGTSAPSEPSSGAAPGSLPPAEPDPTTGGGTDGAGGTTDSGTGSGTTDGTTTPSTGDGSTAGTGDGTTAGTGDGTTAGTTAGTGDGTTAGTTAGTTVGTSAGTTDSATDGTATDSTAGTPTGGQTAGTTPDADAAAGSTATPSPAPAPAPDPSAGGAASTSADAPATGSSADSGSTTAAATKTAPVAKATSTTAAANTEAAATTDSAASTTA